nr:LamG domain-containing protein [Bacteroidota bacterium]
MKSIAKLIFLLMFSLNLVAQDYGLDYSGSNQYVNCGLVVVTGANPRTIEAWVYTRTFDTGGVWQFGDPGSDLGEFTLRTHGSIDDRWVAQLWTEDFDINVAGSKNAWTHFALVYDGTNVKVYANGDLKANQERSLNTISNTFYIGKWGGNYFDGQIDELHVWNTARTQEEIQSTMNVELTGSESGLLAYYPMNEGSGTAINDNSTNSYTGTLFGSPTWVDGVFQPTGSGT